jgi:FMN phosphatase YigB (HAD superfamily)
MTVRAVTVDLDDTLFPQEQWLTGAWRAVADRATMLGLDGAALLRVLPRICAEGSDRGGIIDRALVAVGARPEPHVAALVAAFAAHAPARLSCYPGVPEALARLTRRLPVVCVTDGNPRIQRAKLDALGLGGLLAGVVVSDELGGRAVRKPHPAPFLRALELLGLTAAEVVHVGDRPEKDVVGPAGVGMRSIRVTTGEYARRGTADPAQPTPWRTVGSFAEAAELCLAAAGPARSGEVPAPREQNGGLARL